MKPNIITKIEEQQAYQVISNKLILPATVAFNRGLKEQTSLRLKPITEDEVRKSIRKTGRMNHNPNATNPSGYDIVRYQAKTKNKHFPITFDIKKSPSQLYVEWHHDFESHNETGSQRSVVFSNLREGKFDDIIASIIKEAAEPGMRLTRKEERAGYDFLIKVVVPKVLNDLYMRFIKKHPREYTNERKYPRINTTDITKNMKKQRSDVDSVTYESVINDHVFFSFFLKKGQVNVEPRYPGEQARKENRLLIGVSGPMNTNWEWYDVTTV